MKRQKVDSSNIESIGYDEESKTLEVEFKSSNFSLYKYENFEPEKWKEFLNAESKGKFFGKEIRGKYKTEKIGPDFEVPIGYIVGPYPAGMVISENFKKVEETSNEKYEYFMRIK